MDILSWDDEYVRESIFRFYKNNIWFGYPCAQALFGIMNIVKPKRIIEIGSGFSTAAMLDINECIFENSIGITCIEPRPDRLKKLIKDTDNICIFEKDLQEIPTDFFGKLEENDILFIDSSHVARTGSDVNYEIFEILPRLNKGVIIHFHDVQYPFEYKYEWVKEGRAYNEQYLIRALLMNSEAYSVQLFGWQLNALYSERIPYNVKNCGAGSLWLKKEVEPSI